MTGYIYQIENLQTHKSYIGQTTDIKKRKRTHWNKLRNNTHCNPKLQNAWNKYGEQEFHFRYWEFEVEKQEELDRLECEYIEKFDSIENGYNIAEGGGKPPSRQKVDNEKLAICLCIIVNYDYCGRTLEEILGYSKGTLSALKRRIRYPKALDIFDSWTPEERKRIADKNYNEWEVEKHKIARQITQGKGRTAKSCILIQDQFNMAFAAREEGYGYSCIGLYLGVKPATVKDWFNGRSRAKEKEKYDTLSNEEKQKIHEAIPREDLQKLENEKERYNRIFVKKGGRV